MNLRFAYKQVLQQVPEFFFCLCFINLALHCYVLCQFVAVKLQLITNGVLM
jgi:hypothetical protein